MPDPHATGSRVAKVTVVEIDGASRPVEVRVAGFAFRFEITNPSDASFTLTEIAPDGRWGVLAEGSEW